MVQLMRLGKRDSGLAQGRRIKILSNYEAKISLYF